MVPEENLTTRAPLSYLVGWHPKIGSLHGHYGTFNSRFVSKTINLFTWTHFKPLWTALNQIAPLRINSFYTSSKHTKQRQCNGDHIFFFCIFLMSSKYPSVGSAGRPSSNELSPVSMWSACRVCYHIHWQTPWQQSTFSLPSSLHFYWASSDWYCM